MNILILGDSHSNVFEYSNTKQNMFRFDVCIVGGATAQGMVNPGSKSNALLIFANKINNSRKKYDKIIIMLGEVDCGFLIWVRSKKYNISVDEQIKTSVNNLFTFIKNTIISRGYQNKDIIVAGAILPTIKDSTDKELLSGLRSEVDVCQIIRTEKTIEYNNILKKNCDSFGHSYTDITKYLIGDEGIVKDKYLNTDPNNHHLDNDKTYNLWISKIRNIVLSEQNNQLPLTNLIKHSRELSKPLWHLQFK